MEKSLAIVEAAPEVRDQLASQIPELVHATGPISYDYHFPERSVFDRLVTMSWLTDGSVFAAEATHIALADNELQGIEIGFGGSQWLGRKAALGPLWKQMLASGNVTQEEMTVVFEHSGHASWLNPVVPEDVYYVHALSVPPAARGKGVGMNLLSRARDRARDAGYRGLQLDVLSDNPAVNFYHSMGLELLVESRAPKPQAAGVPPEFRMGIVF